ncbi:RNA polymerase II transcriptional coactivator KIWI-like [Vicia villosa]|uniref:RNA polymerase II transcriptional coactivator KIWI-like n=1 Tax=Vicia villosa TaxID=3911 RepID=UPI00273B6835|nr:RNA polymerase II transcriptional coactivator KIWI-like [Vicia villosa]
MSATGKGKKREELDQASDGDSEGRAPAKKVLKKDSDDDNSDDITVCEIGKNRKVTVRIWQGKLWVDIREFYIKDGKQLPGKKGISLSMDQWNVLRDHIEDIDKAVVEKS